MTKDSTTLSTTWRKSSYSGANGDCVEVGVVDQAVAVRDSKQDCGPAFLIPDHGWGAFVSAVAEGRI
ncbi:DUF397 domain-containing protein [Streptomyces sp. NPDC002640]